MLRGVNVMRRGRGGGGQVFKISIGSTHAVLHPPTPEHPITLLLTTNRCYKASPHSLKGFGQKSLFDSYSVNKQYHRHSPASSKFNYFFSSRYFTTKLSPAWLEFVGTISANKPHTKYPASPTVPTSSISHTPRAMPTTRIFDKFQQQDHPHSDQLDDLSPT
jgi:hypothetical protein